VPTADGTENLLGFTTLDYTIVGLYLAGVTIAGALFARTQNTSRDYFLGGKQMSWWSVGFSIVASETSTLTFISIPGLAYQGNMHFLQVAIGYFIGRLLVSVVFIPAYYRGDLATAYEFLGRRYGPGLRKFASTVFIITRVLASGVRLFATAIPIHIITGLEYPASILLIGCFTLLYTYLGGLRAVVAMDVVQLCIYLTGAAVAMVLMLSRLPGGWSDVLQYATAGGMNKFEIVNLSWGTGILDFLSSPYTLLGGLIGGTFLTMASHGTDQLLVQRLLGCRSRAESQRALMLDATIIVLQFAFFLLLGLCLYAFYGGVPYRELGITSSDEIFPKFIVENLPSGISGLVIAGVLASAMGTLSSSISSLASSTHLDLFKMTSRGQRVDAKGDVAWSRAFTLFWGLALIGGAMLFTDTRNPVVEIGLKIASVTYGGVLGTFFLGLLFPQTTARDAFAGLIAGLLAMVAILGLTTIAFTWHTLIGCLVTLAVGNLRSILGGSRAAPPRQ
jgi:solute:Na+ symporter, SSS family